MILDLKTVVLAANNLGEHFTLSDLENELNKDRKIINRIDIVGIQELCERVTGCKSLHSKKRFKENVLAKILFAYFVRKYYGYSLQRIGDLMDKNHATIVYYLNRVSQSFEGYDPDLQKLVLEVEQMIEKINTPVL